MADSPPSPPAQSQFVTVVAWIVITLAGFMTAIALLQTLLVFLVFPENAMQQALQESDAEGMPMPLVTRLLLENFRLFFLSFLILCAVSLAAGIGLLKRLNWARMLLIVLLLVGVAWNVGSAAMMFSPGFFPPPPTGAPDDIAATFAQFTRLMQIVTVLFSLALSGLFGWIIVRLMSPEVRREFAPRA